MAINPPKIQLPNITRFARMQSGELERIQEAALQKRNVTLNINSFLGVAFNPAGQMVTPRPSKLDRKIAWWSKRSAKGISRYKAQSDFIRPDWRQIQKDMEGLLQAVGVAVVDQMDLHLGQQAFDAHEEWPVDTGLSRALLFVGVNVDPGMITGSFGCGAPYTSYIRQRKTEAERRKAYLVRGPDGSWSFDQDRWERKESGKKRAKGRPYQKFMTRAGLNLARKIGKGAIEQAAREAPK